MSSVEIASPNPVPPNFPGGRRVGLLKRFKDAVLFVGRNTDPGISHGKTPTDNDRDTSFLF
jgi:hypothetical protein